MTILIEYRAFVIIRNLLKKNKTVIIYGIYNYFLTYYLVDLV